MSADPPPPPQISPDGKFYWDGSKWVPMQGQAPAQPPPIVQQQRAQVPAGYEIKKKGHFWRNGLLGCGGIIALIILIPICASFNAHSTSSSSSSSPAPSATSTPSSAKATGCSPVPCASAYSLTVRISGLNRNAPPGTFLPPEKGNHVVLMEMTMHNDGGQDTKSISPYDFKLRDSAGVAHNVTFSDTPGCDTWSSVELAPGATYGPKPLCFEASGDPSGKLTLVWTPGLFSPPVEILL